MSGTSKLFVILQFLLVIGFLFFSLKTMGKIDHQHAIIDSLKEGITSQEAAAGSLHATIGTATEAVTSLRGQREHMKGVVRETKEQLAQTERARDEAISQRKAAQDAQQVAESAQRAAESAQKTAENNLAESKTENEKITGQLNDTKTEVAALQNQLKTLRSDVTDLTAANRRLEEKAALQTVGFGKSEEATIAELRTKNAAFRTEVSQLRKELTDKTGRSPALEGEVVATTMRGVTGLSFPGATIPRKGDLYYASRSGRIVGKFNVGDVYRTILVFNRTPAKTNKYIQTGDKVKLIKK